MICSIHVLTIHDVYVPNPITIPLGTNATGEDIDDGSGTTHLSNPL